MPVLYWPHADDRMARCGDQPLAATITAVWGPSMVNLAICDANGLNQNRTSVLLMQGVSHPNDMAASVGRFCEFPAWFVELMKSRVVFTHAPVVWNDALPANVTITPFPVQAQDLKSRDLFPSAGKYGSSD